MKKGTKWLIGGVIAIGIFGASTVDDTTPVETTGVVEEVKEEEKAEEVVKEKKVSTPPKVEKQEVDQEYIDKMSNYVQTYSQGFDMLSIHSGLASEDPFYFGSEEFIMGYAMGLTYIQSSIDEVKKLKRPSGALGEAHDLVVEAGTHYQKVVDEIPPAVDNRDLDALDKTADYMREGTELLQEAQQILKTEIEAEGF